MFRTLPGAVFSDKAIAALAAATAQSELAALDSALLATRTSGGQWQSLTAVSLGQRQHVDAAIGALLETLAVVPDLLEVPPTH